MTAVVSSAPAATSTAPLADRKQWLEQSIVRRMVAPVKTTVAEIVATSPFLCAPPPPVNKSLPPHQPSSAAVFARHELIIDPTPLGTGGFSSVHAITHIQLDARISARCTATQQELREAMRDNVWQQLVQGQEQENSTRPAPTIAPTPRFVLKHLQRQLLMSNPKTFQSALRDLALEVEYMGRLSHPHILPLLGRPVDGLDAMSSGCYDAFFLVTERLETTLSSKIKDWNVTRSSSGDESPGWEQRMPYLEQLGQALAYLHQHRLVFRDLKPANVGITNHGTTIKLFDFGLCRDLPADNNENNNDENGERENPPVVNGKNDTYVMSGVGTQRYMAYEVLAGLPYNCQVDVYSWALLSWEILTGCRPYLRHGNNSHKMAVLLHDERPGLPDRWPAWLQAVLNQSWCRDIAERHTMAEAIAVIHDHTKRSVGSTASQPPLTSSTRAVAGTPSPLRQHRRTTGGLAVANNNNNNNCTMHHTFLREQSLALQRQLRQQQQQGRPQHPTLLSNENHRPPVRLAVPVRISSVYW